jgi:eukaryotic-like serine/threonine-protein kinase
MHMSNPPSGDRWQEVDALFSELLDLDPAERDAHLDRRCADDPGLRDAVEELLSADSESQAFLSHSAAELVGEALAAALAVSAGPDPADERIGERVGSFRVVRELGRGGMAGVYLAERADGAFEQLVAIKFLRRGLDTDDFVRRFLAERQILSSLHHPNIARLIDGGTTDRGLPYLALEYVDGVRLTDYCDRERCSVEDRLRLFVEVAKAVQYAHANLIVHRDIKPSNILVTQDGRVKLLDFGIAKLLDPASDPGVGALTQTGQRPFTPEYASPEQVRGEAITTASDVYQLGILLYRLLTGERPYNVFTDGSSLEGTITETRPTAPSIVARRCDREIAVDRSSTPERLSRRLRGDLDTIVLKALRKEPQRRYGSAIEMAEDVRRHLEGRPITARRDSRVYRIRKLLRRNAWVTPVAALVLLLLASYIVTLIRHGRELEAERNVAREVQNAFVGFFTAPDSLDVGLGEGRRDLTVRDAILEGADRLEDQLADRPAARAELLSAMAAVLYDLDESERARPLGEEALTLQDSLYGPRSVEYLNTLLLLGDLMRGLDRDSARILLTRHLELTREVFGQSHAATARSLQSLGLLEFQAGNFEEGARLLEESVRVFRTESPVPSRRLAEALQWLGDNYLAQGRVADAVEPIREAYQIFVAEYGPRHSQSAIAGEKLATVLGDYGEIQEARKLYGSSIAVMDSELGPTNSITINARNNYALLLANNGDLQGAENLQREVLEARMTKFGPNHEEVASSLQNLAATMKGQGRYEEADSLAMAAYRMYRDVLEPGHYLTAYPLISLSEIRLIRGDYVGAGEAAREATLILRAALPEGHFATAIAECRWGRALAGQGEFLEARQHLEAAAPALKALEREGYSRYRDECLTALEELPTP